MITLLARPIDCVGCYIRKFKMRLRRFWIFEEMIDLGEQSSDKLGIDAE